MRGRAQARAVVVVASVAMTTACATSRAADLYVVDGARLSPREIDVYCGSRSIGATCAAPTCAAGEAIDLRASACVAQRTVRAIIARDRPSPLPEATTFACRDDHALVTHGDHAVCLARADTCVLTTHWNAVARACLPDPACPSGEVRAAHGEQGCVRVVTSGVLDVGRWARAVLGPDGGVGDDRLCRALSQAPWDLDVGPGGSRTLALAVDLSFPNNDVAQASATLSPAELLPAQARLDALLIPLRALGGTADAASATVRLTCPVQGGSSPLLLPP